VVNDGGAHEVIAPLMALVNGGQQEHHVLVELTPVVPLAHLVDALHDDLVDDFRGVPVDQSHPRVDHEPLLLELHLDSFDHLDHAHDVVQALLRRLLTATLVHQN